MHYQKLDVLGILVCYGSSFYLCFLYQKKYPTKYFNIIIIFPYFFPLASLGLGIYTRVVANIIATPPGIDSHNVARHTHMARLNHWSTIS